MNRIFTGQFLIELLVAGLLTVIFGYVVGFIMAMIYKIDLPDVCKEWNKDYVMEQTLFFTGVLLYLSYELSGVNKYINQ